jgi:hypothetical protein
MLFFYSIYNSDLITSSSSAWKDTRGSGADRKREKDRDHASDSRHDGKKSYFEKPVEEVKEFDLFIFLLKIKSSLFMIVLSVRSMVGFCTL